MKRFVIVLAAVVLLVGLAGFLHAQADAGFMDCGAPCGHQYKWVCREWNVDHWMIYAVSPNDQPIDCSAY